MTELLPCPFCGGEAEVQNQSRELYGDVVDWYGVYCRKQFCGYVSGQSTEAKAIAAWNTRYEKVCKNVHEWRDGNNVLHRDARIFKCSECGFKADDFFGDNEGSFPNYCPHCGAKVMGERKC